MKKLVSLLLAMMLVLSSAVVFTASAAEITDLTTYETTARELETWNIQYSQAAQDLNILCNLIDGLLTNNNHGQLIGNAAKEWSSDDNGQTWKFVLNEGMTWVDKDGNVKADVKASDWLYGLEWVMNFAKNDAYNTSMPAEMIVGAQEYYDYTKNVADTEGVEAAKALDINGKFAEMVGIECPDDYTIIYHCVAPLAYFPTVATYNCLYPVSDKLIAELGVDGYKAVTWENMWYSGPYTISNYIYQNEKVFTANPNYWNADGVKRFNTVTVKMVEDTGKAFTLFETGEIDDMLNVPQAQLITIYENEGNEWHNYLSEARPTKYSYQMHFTFNVLNEDGTEYTNWNTAIANLAFRKSLYYGLDLTSYLRRTNAINPFSCENYCYTANGVCTTSDGTDYTQLVRNELGLDYSNESFNRCDPEKAAAYKAQAIEELTAKGVTFPVELRYYIKGDNQTAKDTADTLKQIYADCLGEDYIKFTIMTYVSNQTQEVRKPQLNCLWINGWGADFGDPINFLGQETYGEDSAYYANNYSMINKASDEQLIADYKEYTALVNAAKAETADLDARYAAFAKAEAFFIDHCFTIPDHYEVAWSLTSVNTYSKIYCAYGMQAYRYVNWQTNDQVYTTDEVAALKTAYMNNEY